MQLSIFTILPLLLSSAAAAALDTAEVREARSLDQSSSPNNVGGGLLSKKVECDCCRALGPGYCWHQKANGDKYCSACIVDQCQKRCT
ncbi:hypothetical protein HER10_EVM0008823 [Colletotrichum scovillei]|uniref:Uncharacterized protein n=1 Tax=Colletotrichum scovillei TaxID=1209932 RepID=A0A9P7R7V0_9PEZI|nr:uncharacterized protein HER10_EVM0008823 [Colletotrichum scovillei]KAF4782188.1 hypothetical protein HER10_EVM0008823 [Colletotrichum scovillei]KAG7050514.1 hypothetical protein JMJ77_0013261 [Colletotrichum scovillei]KAG7069555.1 hypothetical protein JMJ76_0003223 [Colletotrichum scovillei]KAG7073506.1 hypothetical protein JMJ78_0014480 [Colletotrichum scovillei]